MKKQYEVTVLYDAAKSVTVEAESPDEAEDLAYDEAGSHVTLCHQCADEVEVGDSLGVFVYCDGDLVSDTTSHGQASAALKVALARVAELEAALAKATGETQA